MAIFGAIGSGKTTGCMMPFAEQILAYRAQDPDKRVSGLVPQFATATGLEGISPGRNVQFIPYGISTRAKFLDTDSGWPGL